MNPVIRFMLIAVPVLTLKWASTAYSGSVVNSFVTYAGASAFVAAGILGHLSAVGLEYLLSWPIREANPVE